jgi:hypothetical protein
LGADADTAALLYGLTLLLLPLTVLPPGLPSAVLLAAAPLLLLLLLVLLPLPPLLLWGLLDVTPPSCRCWAISRVLMTSAGVLTREATSPEHMLAAVCAHTPSGTAPLDSTADLACSYSARYWGMGTASSSAPHGMRHNRGFAVQ